MNKNIQRGLLLVGAIGVTAANAAIDAAVSTAITGAVTTTLEVIAVGGAALLTVAGGGVVWQVASKFVKRLGGKA
ncbi:MAG: hypothetical protein A3E00_13775 [Curvibacter sp. RIFCSPHIGHO2_12_FULL_63_18]|nr:MAG: hypothetical protein A3E00_13775 [Curvibacter sp. RIFCSPHIGHO2_12_FULL_63_18]